MAAPAGNRFWEARSSHGRKPIFASPEDLWEACAQYFEWVEANPLYTTELVKFQGSATEHMVPKMRAMTMGGLCIFLDIDRSTWSAYAQKKDFSETTTQVEEVIREQKFTGAAAELLNPNIIARDLGLAEKTELTGQGGGPITIKAGNLSDSAMEELLAARDAAAQPE